MELKNIFNKGFWIGLSIGIVLAIFWIVSEKGLLFYSTYWEFLFIYTQLPILLSSLLQMFLHFKRSTLKIVIPLIIILVTLICVKIVNLISNKIQKNYLKWIFVIFSVIFYGIINFIAFVASFWIFGSD